MRKYIYILFDLSNGDGIEPPFPGEKRYLWWFTNHKQAMKKYEEHQRRFPEFSKLSRPVKYVRSW